MEAILSARLPPVRACLSALGSVATLHIMPTMTRQAGVAALCRTVRYVLGLIVLAILAPQPVLAGGKTLPAGCTRSKLISGVGSIDSPWFREGQGEKQWILVYPNPRREKQGKPNPGALVDPVDPERIMAAPEAEGRRLLAAAARRLCGSLPEGLELKWSAFLQRDFGSTGKTWLTVNAHQLIDGLPVDRHFCFFNYSRRGELQNFRCQLLRPEIVRLPLGEWPSDKEVAAIAGQAYLEELRNLPGPGQRPERIERKYTAEGPTIEVEHAGCGVTRIDVGTGESRYVCSERPVRPRHGVLEPRELVTVVELKAPGFEPAQVVAANRDGAVLVVGNQSRAWTDETGVEHAPGQQLLLVDRMGRKRWQRALGPNPNHEPAWLRVDEGRVQVLRQPSGYHSPGPVHSRWLSLATGETLAEESFDLPWAARLLPDKEGQRLFLARQRPNNSHDLIATDPSGKVLWKARLPEAFVHDMISGAGGGPVVLVSRDSGRDRQFSLEAYSRDGEQLWHVKIALPLNGNLELLGVNDHRAYVLLNWLGDDTKGQRELRVFSTRDGKLVQRRFLPTMRRAMQASGEGVLYLGQDDGWAVAGVAGGARDWRRYFGFGGVLQEFVGATDMGDGTMVFVGRYSERRQTIHTPGRFALARVAVSRPGAVSPRSDDCPLVSEDALRELELRLWRQYHVYLQPELFDYTPDTDCIDRHRGGYFRFLEVLAEALSARGYRAPSFFVRVQAEPGQPGVRFRGGGVGYEPRWGGQRSYTLRAGFGDARPLAEFLFGGLLPHLRRVDRWRQDFTTYTGFQLNVSVPWGSDQEPAVALDTTLAELERELSALVTIARSLPASQYPDFGGLGDPPPLDLIEGALHIPAGNHRDPEKRLTVATLEAQQLQAALGATQQAEWDLRSGECDAPSGTLAKRAFTRATYCRLPELITSAALKVREGNRQTPGFMEWPALHETAYDPGLLRAALAAGADKYATDNFGNTVLHAAVEQNARASIAYLAGDQRLVDTAAYDGATPLHRAVFRPRYPAPVLEPLVRESGDIDARNLDGETALHLAVHSPELVALLLSAGADANARDGRGRTPLHRAASTWLARDSIELLLDAGADIDATDAESRTPLALAREYRLPENLEALGQGAGP